MKNETKCPGAKGVYVYSTSTNGKRYAIKLKFKKNDKWTLYKKRGFPTLQDAQNYRIKLAKLKFDGRFFPENIDMDFYRNRGVGRRLPSNSKIISEAWGNVDIPRNGVYFIQPVAGGLIKIGYTDDIYKRFRQIQYHSPIPLHVLGVVPGDKVLEIGLHLSFIKERHHGEWFLPQGKVREFLSDRGLKFIDPMFTYTKDWDEATLGKLREHFASKPEATVIDMHAKEAVLVSGQS